MESLAGKVFILVDAASDVGQAVARTFAKYSAKVTLCGSQKDEVVLEKLAKECLEGRSGKVEVLTMPVSDLHSKAEMERTVQKTVEKFGSLNGLVYLVSHEANKTFEETTMDDLNSLHVSHVESPLLWVQASVAHLKASKGNVVLLSAGQSASSMVGRFPFALTKAAEDHLVRTMSLDLAAYGIRVNAVCPMLPTEQTEKAKKDWEEMKTNISEYVTYLSTAAAAFITGQCVTIGNDFSAKDTRF